jgi:uncharacterized protein DUF5686/carboxypeptidase-like protein
MKYVFFFLLGFTFHCGFAQQVLHGVVADSISKKALPFATIKAGSKQNAVISGIDGHFSFPIHAGVTHIIISYVGYTTKNIAVDLLKNKDTIFLTASSSTLQQVTVLPQTEKIKRILSNAIRNKPLHNPEMYNQYQCFIYYKMHADLLRFAIKDSTALTQKSSVPGIKNVPDKLSKKDSSFLKILEANNHLIFSETFSRRNYKRPMQLQEDVIASRFSGLKKTYFTFLVTDVLPFHVYGDYITLNGTDYINPVAKGWQQRYHFQIADEIYSGSDTIFILTFRPKKNTAFNSLKGVVYINSDGYAISHFIGSTGDSSDDREAKIEQIYTRINEKWFPKELNYDLVLKKFPNPRTGIQLNGHSVIDSVSFDENTSAKFHKAHPVTLGDSVDLFSDKDWQRLRPDSITQKEMNTYHTLDSISKNINLENKVSATGKLAVGKLGINIFDLDINRLYAYNKYEGTRAGIGLYTNDKVSKYYSAGGWFGYGFTDSRWKYGVSATIYPAGEKDNWFKFSYQDNYQSTGDVHVHADIDKLGFRNWLLSEVDRIKQYSIIAHTQRGYWEIELNGTKENLQSLYNNNFEFAGKNLSTYDVKEAGIGIKYAYGEKRIPLFGYYMPFTVPVYPIIYFRFNAGNINSGTYSANYFRSLIAVTYTKHVNRWGNDKFQLEAGGILTLNDQPLSRSFLLAGKGFRNDQFNYYAWGGFLTMRPYDYFSDKYVSLFYKHDFDKFLWQWKYSKPFISISHNILFGSLASENKTANTGIISPLNGYQESGLLINQLLLINYMHLANIYLNTGPFYHWATPFSIDKNAIWVVGISAGF